MASKIVINLDTSKESYMPAKCKQNDDLTLEASIFENGLEKDLTNCEITIQALKADSTYIIQNTDITKLNNKIIANLDRDFTRAPGKTEIEIVLVESGKQNTTFSFTLEVVGSVIRGAVESSNTVTILEELGNKIVEAGQVRDETEHLIATGGAATKGDIQEINSQLEQKTNQTQTESIQSQINGLVLASGGDSNLEVVQARVDNQGNSFPTLKNNIDNLSNLLLNNEFRISYGDWVQGAIQSDGYENTDVKYIRTSNFHTFNEIVEITPSDGFNYRIAKYNLDGSIISISSFITTKTIIGNDNTVKYKFTIGKVDGSNIVVGESGSLIMKVERNIKYNENGASFINVSKNLVDNKNMKLNTVINATTGLEESNSRYACTDFIPYKLHQELYVSRYRNYVMYDGNKNKILVNTTETTTKSLIKITSSSLIDVAYVRFSVYKEDADTTIASYTDYTEQDEYGLWIDKLRLNRKNIGYDMKNYLDDLIHSISASINNPLLNKKILNFGDSISAGDGNNGVGVAELIASRNNMTVYDYAVGGATVTEITVGGNNIITKINQAITNGVVCDYIIFNGLTNDINGGAVQPLGVITSGYSDTLDKTTFCGAFEYICKTLKTQWLGAKILYFRPHNMSSRNLNNQKIYGEKAKEICKKWGIPIVDLFEEGGLNTNILEMKNTYTNNADGTHPNELGYLTYYVPQIENKLKTL